ncbi:hypothetical protein RRF57_011403 [Xylaria bambusicola]|uniref:Protein kinase domain-containing protein n=1 Tax=Xylaria bambusicola TaxID=326684 RepID=A0AAN7ZD62_9PEZI
MQFRTYRRGEPFDERNPEILEAPVELPLAGAPGGVFFPRVKQIYTAYRITERDKFDLDMHDNERLVPSKFRIPWRRSRMMKNFFAERVPGFEYQKTLGWGGNGMAAVFDQVHENGEKWRSIVVKMLFTSDADIMQQEIEINSEHIVQILYDGFKAESEVETDYEDEGEPANPQPGQRQRRPESSPHDSHEAPPPRRKPRIATGEPRLNCFATEMLENVVRMCIGLAYPPDSIEQYKNRPPPITEQIPLKEYNVEPRRICHFDFDPRNIFVGDIGKNAEHRVAPILKVIYCNLAIEDLMDKSTNLSSSETSGWLLKYCEQFCEDWDYIDPDDGSVHLHRIAGNYGMHTNLWAVGLVMESLITLCHPAQPPTPTLVKCREPPYEDYYTYAAHLQSAAVYIDEELIHIVMRLQAHEIIRRHTFEELSAMGLTNKGNFGMTDQQILAWFQKTLNDVPPDRDEEVDAILAAAGEQPVRQPRGPPQQQQQLRPVDNVNVGLLPPQQPLRQPRAPPPPPQQHTEIIGVPPVNPLPDHTFNPMGNQLPGFNTGGRAGRPARRGLRSRYRRAGRWEYNNGGQGPARPPTQPRRIDRDPNRGEFTL